MATLQIRKETVKVWRHVPSDELPYIVSKLYIKSEGDNIRVVELGGSQRGIYNFADVSVYDIGGVAETFTSASELMQRLEALGYIGFFYEGEVSPSTLISADLGNIIELGSDGKLYAVGGGGGSQDLQSVLNEGNISDKDIRLNDSLGGKVFEIDTTNKLYGIGDIDANNGETFIKINDNENAIDIRGQLRNSLVFNGGGASLSTTLDFTGADNNVILPEENGTIATREWANENKVDKVTTAGVERVYTINADGSQGTKPTSELGGTFVFSQRNLRLSATLTAGNWHGFVVNTNFAVSNFATNYGTSILAITDANLRAMNGFIADGINIKKLNHVIISQPNVEVSIDFEIEIWKYDFQQNVANATALNLRKVISFHEVGSNNNLTGKIDKVVSTDAIDTPASHFSKYIIFLKTNGGSSFIYPAIDWNFQT